MRKLWRKLSKQMGFTRVWETYRGTRKCQKNVRNVLYSMYYAQILICSGNIGHINKGVKWRCLVWERASSNEQCPGPPLLSHLFSKSWMVSVVRVPLLLSHFFAESFLISVRSSSCSIIQCACQFEFQLVYLSKFTLHILRIYKSR